ncbi:60S ribosomal protein L28, putative [Pediculus humanus corporis]|uniref:Large ribosomal subunit protein eL28 n=1 Tax=Pediculus humanus subsp. corporis TaxID=121224 RepID=E0VXJ0_PEDHC|nr:60S ribosomal protein L28, putative [Pediculus humanus corporis]EEB18096.1 60S ribosomal protein L28, putative [Pediculus humanus corporis]
MSSHLNWMIIRNNNAFLVKKTNIKKPFSKEPNNLTNLNSFRYNGIIHKKCVGIEGGKAPEKKGFTVIMKKAKAHYRPAKSCVQIEMKSGPRRSLYKLRRLLVKNRYRMDLTKAALRRASAVLRSQRAPKPKKTRAKKTE